MSDIRAFLDALTEAAKDGRLRCESIAFYRDASEAPMYVRTATQGGHAIIAWRDGLRACMALHPQFIEQVDLDMAVSVSCSDLNHMLDMQECWLTLREVAFRL
jgi:hypothetical protein